MKATKTMTTIAAAALVSVIGMAYAQNSDSTLDPASTPQNPPAAVVVDQMPAQSDAMTAPAESMTPADPSQTSTTATDANAATATPAPTTAAPADSSAPTYTAPSPSSPELVVTPERAPRSDRN